MQKRAGVATLLTPYPLKGSKKFKLKQTKVMKNVELIELYNAISKQLNRVAEPEKLSVSIFFDGEKTIYKYSLYSVGENFVDLNKIIKFSDSHVNPKVLAKTLELNIDFLLEKEVSDGSL